MKKHSDDEISNSPRTSCSGSRCVRTMPRPIVGPSQISIATTWNVQRAQTRNGTGSRGSIVLIVASMIENVATAPTIISTAVAGMWTCSRVTLRSPGTR